MWTFSSLSYLKDSDFIFYEQYVSKIWSAHINGFDIVIVVVVNAARLNQRLHGIVHIRHWREKRMPLSVKVYLHLIADAGRTPVVSLSQVIFWGVPPHFT